MNDDADTAADLHARMTHLEVRFAWLALMIQWERELDLACAGARTPRPLYGVRTPMRTKTKQAWTRQRVPGAQALAA